MDQVDKYKRIEDDQQQGKGKAKVTPQKRRDFRLDRYRNNRPRRDYVDQSRSNNTQVVGAVFQEPVHQVLEKSRMNPSLNDPIRWWAIPKSETETSIANTIRIMGIPQRIVRVCGII